MPSFAERGFTRSLYPERAESRENAFDAWARAFASGWAQRLRPFRPRLRRIARRAGHLGQDVRALSDEQLRIRMREVARGAFEDPQASGASRRRALDMGAKR